MPCKSKWRTRTTGTKRQKGKAFVMSPSPQTLKSKLRSISGAKKSGLSRDIKNAFIRKDLLKERNRLMTNGYKEKAMKYEEKYLHTFDTSEEVFKAIKELYPVYAKMSYKKFIATMDDAEIHPNMSKEDIINEWLNWGYEDLD